MVRCRMRWLAGLMLLAMPSAICVGEVLRQMAFDPMYKTLKVIVNEDDMQPPVIVLGTNDVAEISFDNLSPESKYLRYELIHCNHDWTPSGIVDSEFIDGFNEGGIEDIRHSVTTTVQYVHYSFVLPNEHMPITASGNYIVRVFDEDDSDKTLLQFRLMVSEGSAGVYGEATSRTDVEYNGKYQQLDITADVKRSGVADKFNDLRLVVRQNGRDDNAVTLTTPARVLGDKVNYSHVGPLIFPAGNEYRRMENASYRFIPMGVEDVAYQNGLYHFTLFTDEARNEDAYTFDETQKGRFRIREYNSADAEVEGDYVATHFALDIPEIYTAYVYIEGDLTNRIYDGNSMMYYNRETGRYEKTLLLKQGAYNYQYVALPHGSDMGVASVIEGDFYETGNEYFVALYVRRPGERYDRLIGTCSIDMHIE